jgi:hypothetical protein
MVRPSGYRVIVVADHKAHVDIAYPQENCSQSVVYNFAFAPILNTGDGLRGTGDFQVSELYSDKCLVAQYHLFESRISTNADDQKLWE